MENPWTHILIYGIHWDPEPKAEWLLLARKLEDPWRVVTEFSGHVKWFLFPSNLIGETLKYELSSCPSTTQILFSALCSSLIPHLFWKLQGPLPSCFLSVTRGVQAHDISYVFMDKAQTLSKNHPGCEFFTTPVLRRDTDTHCSVSLKSDWRLEDL